MNSGVSDLSRGQRTLAAIVLTDAVGFSAQMSEDEESTLSLIHQDLGLMEQLCQEFEGRVIKSTGDGLLMYFASAVQAVSCSLKIQTELQRVSQENKFKKSLLHRIGIHLGDVFLSGDDVMGNGVNIAARLQTEAMPGRLCISQVVYDVVKSKLSLNAMNAGELHLKNIAEPQPAYHVDPHQEGPYQEDGAEDHKTAVMASTLPATNHHKLGTGSKVGGRYTVQRVLGQGGFGRSYLVEDTQRFGEPCVLKEFFPSNTSKGNLQKALDLFKREAKTLYQINHPQIPTFLACFAQEGRLFIVQEFIDGVTYSQLLKRRVQKRQQFSEAEVTQWLMHMLQVLDYIHALGIVHRDISPDNIMYSRDRQLPILIDFGLVNDAMTDILSGSVESTPDRNGATMVGKFGYSPPEQIRLGQCFPCSDLYALGVTAIVLLTGSDPRDLLDRLSLEWQWQKQVQLSQPLTQVLNRLLEQKPSDRFQTAQAVLDVVIPLLSAGQATSPLPNLTGSQRIDLSPVPNAAPHVSGPLQMAAPSVLQDQVFIEQCRQELTRCVGPMASMLIEDALEQNPNANPEEFVNSLASHISDPQQASTFSRRIDLPTRSGFSRSSSITGGSSFATDPLIPQGASGPSSQSAPSPEFLKRCRHVLTQCVGPMADFLLEETLADFPHLDAAALVAHLAAEIPDQTMAQAFQQQLL
ncbi:MAG: protein kinase [Cyanobacteria bacterium]|nr:protein kinase [Cyanobacteriota bacterium]